MTCLAHAQVEFNKAALSLSDAIPADGRKAALNRLLKVGRTINISAGVVSGAWHCLYIAEATKGCD